ncbi:MAG: c-type cytochrome [Propionicimonas sp.]|uniref:cytochrome bc1 complex diheme cytochrome c subunit n=1 Tax=Propionicimonas sp. TaxID=1955623 RepID=UPI002B1EF451|nr:c-type cytochrome [Propionicimonas sp.]MEA4945537.1 c-type cytochrome [Propionicimonas sp.]MEA5116601.1 c-type cytochrome [Propionicimonas sp.]
MRRHKAARPLLVVLALLAVGGIYAAVAPSSVADDTTQAEQVAAGKALFAVSCASCHGLNGEGTPSQGIPALTNVGAAAVDFQVRTGRMPMGNPYAQAPRKENVFTEEETAALAAYVASLGDGPAIPDQAQYDPSGLSAEQLATGGDLFRTNCSACHNFQGSGGALSNGKVAPPLTGATPIEIYEAMRTGPGEMPVFGAGAIPDEDVRAMIGYLDALHAQPSGGLTLGALGPVSEGFWAWVAGIGSLVLFAIWITTKAARK